MGSHLNRSLDNLWFPFLLRNPHWFQAAADHAPQQIIQRLKLLEKAMTGQITPTPGEIALTVRAVAGFLRHRDDTMPEPDTIKNALALLRSRRTDLSAYRGWGWKAPNSQILIDYLPQVFPALIYIQAIRHGLDMAYSTNKRQLRLWGPMFGIDVPEDDHLLPRAALEYWVASNRATIEHGTRLLGDRFYLLNFDQLCADPPTEIARLLAVLSINPGSVDVAHLCSLPQNSVLRWALQRSRSQHSPLGDARRRARLGFSDRIGHSLPCLPLPQSLPARGEGLGGERSPLSPRAGKGAGG